jgi:outer membrane protein TolC
MLLLSACAVGPNYRRPDAPVAGAYKENKDWKPATPAQVPSDQPWWSIYNDPVLDRPGAQDRRVESDAQSLRGCVSLRAGSGRYRPPVAAIPDHHRDRSQHAQRRRQPSESGRHDGAGTAVTTNGTTRNKIYSAGVQGSWQIDVWGRIRRTIESDRDKAQASAADVAAARLSAQT